MKNKWVWCLFCACLGISSAFSENVAFVDSGYSDEVIAQAAAAWTIEFGAACQDLPSLVIETEPYCLQPIGMDFETQSYGHGRSVVKSFLAEAKEGHSIYLVHVDPEAEFYTDGAVFAAALLSTVDIDFDLFNASFRSLDRPITGLGDSLDRDLYRLAGQTFGLLLWAAPNEPGELSRRRLEQAKEYPGYKPIIHNPMTSRWVVVGAENHGEIVSHHPGADKELGLRYLAYSGWAHPINYEAPEFGTSFATPKLAAKILNTAQTCNIPIQHAFKHIKRLADANGYILKETKLTEMPCP